MFESDVAVCESDVAVLTVDEELEEDEDLVLEEEVVDEEVEVVEGVELVEEVVLVLLDGSRRVRRGSRRPRDVVVVVGVASALVVVGKRLRTGVEVEEVVVGRALARVEEAEVVAAFPFP